MVLPLKIGSLQLATNLLLAPLAGFADCSFRRVVRSCGGVGLACTALLSPLGVLRRTRQSLELAETCPDDSPLAFQIYGNDADLLAQAARWCRDHGADAIDLNMGCPVPKITRSQAGSKLLCDPDLAVRLAEAVVKAVAVDHDETPSPFPPPGGRVGGLGIPITVKLRLGWDEQSIVAPQLAARLTQVGVAAIIIHGRTAEMQFRGHNRLEGIAEVVAAVKAATGAGAGNPIPVIGNGDVRTPQDAAEMIRQTGCDGVMIGRWALAAPWIFRDTWSYLTTGLIPPPPSLEEKVVLMRTHFHLLAERRGQGKAALEFRKHIGWYAKQLGPSRMLRQGGQRIKSAREFDQLMDEFLASAPRQA